MKRTNENTEPEYTVFGRGHEDEDLVTDRLADLGEGGQSFLGEGELEDETVETVGFKQVSN